MLVIIRKLGLAVAAIATLLAVPTALAQPDAGREGTRQRHLRPQEMERRLDLSEDQKKQIRPILAESRQRMREARQRLAGQERTRELMNDLREEMRQVQGDTRSRLETVLSPVQLTEYDKVLEEWRSKRRERGAKRAQPIEL